MSQLSPKQKSETDFTLIVGKTTRAVIFSKNKLVLDLEEGRMRKKKNKRNDEGNEGEKESEKKEKKKWP